MYDSEPEAIKGWQQGDEQAVQSIFKLYYPRAVRLAVLSGLESEEAQDCAQEAFLLAFERRYQLRNPNAFPLWFHRIITHHILDFLRARQRKREIWPEAVTRLTDAWERRLPVQPDVAAIVTEERTRLWQNLQKLAPKYRIPLVLRYYGDFSLRDIATLMEKREGTIRVTIHRALHQLRLLSIEEESVQEADSTKPSTQIIHAKIN